MPRHIACLTFDFDAMSGMIANGLTSPTPISRGEFGAVGVARILALLAKHRIRATFFIPGVVIGTYPEACKDIVAAGQRSDSRLKWPQRARLSLAGLGPVAIDRRTPGQAWFSLREQHDGP
jgi:peptidoglycan/xylan/chitin deacetylase (PgdA/CDA1 family)